MGEPGDRKGRESRATARGMRAGRPQGSPLHFGVKRTLTEPQYTEAEKAPRSDKTREGPLDGFSHRAIVIRDERQDLVAQVVQREEIATFEQLAHQDTEPDFYLVHPGSVLGRVVQQHLVGGVVQKRRPAFHRLKDAAFPLDAQRLRCYPFPLGYPAHQRFGLMDIQIIQDHVPLRRCGIAGNQVLEMSQGILLGAGRSPRGLDDVSGNDIKIDEPGQCAMPDVLEFASQHMTRLHR
jgi:hypothetical protein